MNFSFRSYGKADQQGHDLALGLKALANTVLTCWRLHLDQPP
jgi:hypothetical protein